MKRYRTLTWMFLAALLVWTCPVSAQDGDLDDGLDDLDTPGSTDGLDDDMDLDDGLDLGLDELPDFREIDQDASIDDLLYDLTPEERDALITQAVTDRLVVERMQVMAEIENELFYALPDVDKARKILEEAPKNTQKDNIERILAAFAAVDIEFKKAYDLYREGKLEEAVPAAKGIVNARELTYLGAAKHFLLARLLSKTAPDYYQAIDQYGNIMKNMGDRLSFAAAAALETGDLYGANGRNLYALESYIYAVNNYQLTLAPDEQKQLLAKVDELQAIYDKPMEAIAERMKAAREKLAAQDSGQETQDAQEEAVVILTDLIKYLEEQKKPDPNQDSEQGNKSQEGQSQGEGEKQDGQSQSGKPSSKPGSKNSKPTAKNPAQGSYLPGGLDARIPDRTREHDVDDESGDWALLPPRKKQKMKELLQRNLDERNREAIRLYLKARSRTRRESE